MAKMYQIMKSCVRVIDDGVADLPV